MLNPSNDIAPKPTSHRVVVVGGGFGGLALARELAGDRVEVVLIDRRNFHLFQPLLYQVATCGLSPGEIAIPLRKILKRAGNVRVVLAEVTGFDLATNRVHARAPVDTAQDLAFPFDTLVVAAGARHSYFGNDHWQDVAPGMKTIEDALELRRRILTAFEAAEIEADPETRRTWLRFLIVGGGPTGVEMAGQIAEIARDTLRHEFRSIDPREAQVLLVEAAPRILGAFPEELSERAVQSLNGLGVTVRTGFTVTDIAADHVLVAVGDQTERIGARTVVWAAGVQAASVVQLLAGEAGATTDRNGRIVVEPDLTLPGRPDVFALGDMVTLEDPATGRPLPGVCPVAMQQGRHVAKTIKARLAGDDGSRPFRYRDKGNLATIGRLRAVGVIKGVKLRGGIAWLGWLFVHILYLIGFQNRLLVLLRWSASFVTRGRGARLITGQVRRAEAPRTGTEWLAGRPSGPP